MDDPGPVSHGWLPERPAATRADRKDRKDRPGGGRRLPVDLPSTIARAEWLPSARAVSAVLAAVAVAVVIFGVRWAWAAHQQPPRLIRPVAASTGPSAGANPTASPTRSGNTPRDGPGVAGADGAAVELVVDVVGEVNRPGIVRLPAGSRVVDAVQAAGGTTTDADVTVINQARLLVDGEQIRVPRPGEVVTSPAGTPGATGPVGAPSGSGGLVSLNGADLATLDTLPGVGPVLAQRILDWRSTHGRFASVDELGEVPGIGDKLLERLRPLVTL